MKLPSKSDLIIYGGIALAVVWLFFIVKGWHDDSVYKLPAAKAATKQVKQEFQDYQESQELTEVRTDGFTKAVVAISDPSRRISGVVCRNANVPAVPKSPDPSGSAAPGGDPRVPASDPERDVSDGTTVYGKRCEVIRAEALMWRLWYKDQYELSRKQSH